MVGEIQYQASDGSDVNQNLTKFCRKLGPGLPLFVPIHSPLDATIKRLFYFTEWSTSTAIDLKA